jgi:hypothetical protein
MREYFGCGLGMKVEFEEVRRVYLENSKTLSKFLKIVIIYPPFDFTPKNFCPISNS